MSEVSLVGTGYVADLYMRSLQTFPDISVRTAYDRNPARLAQFCAHWKVSPSAGLAELLASSGKDELILNLTNPGEHFNVSFACLQAGRSVYSEKPLATSMEDAYSLHALAARNGLYLASAPCSVLGEAAQTLWHAVRAELLGKVRLVYAEIDDGFVSQAPFMKWVSESGAPWPYADEFRVGCTLEHAGYYLTWLMAMFGSVKTVVAASARIAPVGPAADAAPDLSVATLFFESGVVARLTCSIVADHDHRFRLFCDGGSLEVDESWNNAAPVRARRRFVVRRRLVNSPFAKRIRLKSTTHPKVGRRGAAAMNFALGPAEVLAAMAAGRACRMSADLALHLNEVTLAIQNSGAGVGSRQMQTRCGPLQPMPWAE